MQQNCQMMPTVDELKRAENGDPWAVLLVGILRGVRPDPATRLAQLARLTAQAQAELEEQPHE